MRNPDEAMSSRDTLSPNTYRREWGIDAWTGGTGDGSFEDALDSIGAKFMGGDSLPPDVADEFLNSEEGQTAIEIWKENGGPTDQAVESLEMMLNEFWKRRDTVPEMPNIDEKPY